MGRNIPGSFQFSLSGELAEFPLVCDRVLTLFGGEVTAELAGAASDEASLLRAMHGLADTEAVA